LQQISIFDQYDIEEFTSAHFPLLKLLYKNAFNTDVRIEEIESRFNTNALGGPVIGFIAIHKQTQVPSAYYGVFPFKAIIKDEIVQAAQSGDTMTHSHHRRKGLFATLANLTYEKCKELGIKILIGQPNESSYHGLVKTLGWEHIDEIIRWDLKLKLKTFPLQKLPVLIWDFKNIILTIQKQY
ncbi:MAG: GNAT family N-acetyltransferase, partial [Chitinophagaceae bacterium]